MIQQAIRFASPGGGWWWRSPDARAWRAARRGRSRGSSNSELGHPRGTMAIAIHQRPILSGVARFSKSELGHPRGTMAIAIYQRLRRARVARVSKSEFGHPRGTVAIAIYQRPRQARVAKGGPSRCLHSRRGEPGSSWNLQPNKALHPTGGLRPPAGERQGVVRTGAASGWTRR